MRMNEEYDFEFVELMMPSKRLSRDAGKQICECTVQGTGRGLDT